MRLILDFFKRKSVIQIAGMLALSALIWCAGPLVAFAGHVPLAPEFNRLLAILVLVCLWAAYLLFTQARANHTDQRMISELASPPADPLARTRDDEAADLRRKFEEALLQLKAVRSKSRRGKQYLYELPWYIVIGAPGSGKTTALLNSGLEFPLPNRSGPNALQGVAGTRNCDWFLAEEAIFLDTAGRYTTQDSHQAVDAAAWNGFLNLIKKYRPRQPINGVLVTMSMSDLLQGNAAEPRRIAGEMRQRIQELYKVLRIRFPVYMLFTKCDLISGFSDFFSDLDREQRTQVWGETFQEKKPEPAPDPVTGFGAGFDDLVQVLDRRTFQRIQEEQDIQRRGRILDFPRQMALLKSAMMDFIGAVFSTSRYEAAPLLRGVYFTSGTQAGTPIDQVLGRLARTFGLDCQRRPVFSGRGKTYFITRLLKAVVIPEAWLAGVDRRVERRRCWLQWAAYGCLLTVIALMTVLWSVSYTRNRRALENVQARIAAYHPTPGPAAVRDMGEKSLLERLNVLRKAYDIANDRSWWMRFGLYQGEKLQSAIDRVYSQLLMNEFLPLIKFRLEHRLRTQLQTADSQGLYELLKVYLMLALPEKMNPKLAVRCLQQGWEQRFNREPRTRAQLTAHAAHLLDQPLAPCALDQPLVTAARGKLNAVPLAMQIYAHLKSEALPDHSQDFHLSTALGRYGDRIFTTADGRPLDELVVPGLYTRQGYTQFFKTQGLGFVEQALEQNWVSENPAADQMRDTDRLYDDLQKLYFADYASQWRDLLADLKLIKGRNIYQTVQILDVLSGPDTPLRPLLAAVKLNTSLSGGGATAESQTVTQANPGAVDNTLQQADQQPDSGFPPAPLIELDRQFSTLNALTDGDGKSPPPLDDVLGNLSNLRDTMMQIGNAAHNNEQALKMAGERMGGAGADDAMQHAQMTFGRLPDPLGGWLQDQTSSGWQLTLNNARAELNSIWKTEVLPAYKTGLDQRYPLFRASRDDSTMADFCRFFAPDGIVDRYFQEHLSPFVDTTRPRWRQVSRDNRGIRISAKALQQFQYAARIRDAFFPFGGSAPSIQFELKPMVLDEKAGAFRLDIEGQSLQYRHGPPRSTTFTWPGPRSDLGVRLTFVTFDGREISQAEEGPWALLRILDRASVQPTGLSDRFMVTFRQEGFQARFELRAGSVDNPFNLEELKHFRCPGSI
jgi:type VI secretion system protein ImpL